MCCATRSLISDPGKVARGKRAKGWEGEREGRVSEGRRERGKREREGEIEREGGEREEREREGEREQSCG